MIPISFALIKNTKAHRARSAGFLRNGKVHCFLQKQYTKNFPKNAMKFYHLLLIYLIKGAKSNGTAVTNRNCYGLLRLHPSIIFTKINMKKCPNCSTEHSRKGIYCSDSCKQEAFRYRKLEKSQNSSDSPATNSSLTSISVPTQVENAVYAPVRALGDNVQRSINKSLSNYDFGVSGLALCVLGGGAGAYFVNKLVYRPSAKDYVIAISAGSFLGLGLDVGIQKVFGFLEEKQKEEVHLTTNREHLGDNPIRIVTGAQMQGMSFGGIPLLQPFSDAIAAVVPLHSAFPIIGAPNSGKSYFLTKFAASLSSAHTVLFLSTEQGEDDNVKLRFSRMNALNVSYATVFTKAEVLAAISQFRPSVLIIDSLSNLALSPVEERLFARDLSLQVNLFLYSLHATKEGGFVGSNALLHDATVMIECIQLGPNKFSAIVGKNRCGEVGRDILSIATPISRVFPIAANR